jgi:hypothetical protein
MPFQKDEIDYIQLRIQEMFKISTELERSFPGRKFTLDGHLVGSIGEVIAAYYYNLALLPSSTERHDATALDGRMVQIKATQGAHGIALRSEPEHLIVLWIDDNTGKALEVYNGPGSLVWGECGKLASNGTRSISMSKLKRIATQAVINQRLEPLHPIEKL